MKRFLFMTMVIFAASARAQGPCGTDAEIVAIAQAQATEILSLIGTEMESSNLSSDDGDAFCEDENEKSDHYGACVLKQDVLESLTTFRWSEDRQAYSAYSFLNWYCAAGADCWAYLVYTCDGQFHVVEDGEE